MYCSVKIFSLTPFSLPNHWITKRLFELDWGYLLKDKMHVVVSSGFGTWGPPIRLASQCEIIELVVRFQR